MTPALRSAGAGMHGKLVIAMVTVMAAGERGRARAGRRSPVPGWCAAIALLSGSLLTAGAAAPALASPAARLAAGQVQALNEVYCTSAGNCWAVGNEKSTNGTVNQFLHWTAGRWRRVTVPNPGGTAVGDNNNLNAVRCASAASCWAVGDDQPLGSARLDQVLHWNGRKWSAVPAPAPGGTSSTDFSELDDVACTSAGSCWAVGYYGIEMSGSGGDSVVELSQALHWDGAKWSLVSTPNPGGHSKNHVNRLNAVRCGSPANCWAAGTDGLEGSKFLGRNLVLHWNGSTWTTAKVPDPGGTAAPDFNQIQGLSCTSAANCWAAGSYGRELAAGHQKLLHQILHWNGKKWAVVRSPNPDGTGARARNSLLAVTCNAAKNCWAVGWTGGVNGRPGLNDALHWNGGKWSVVRTPDSAKNGDTQDILTSIRCTSSARCWAVGVVEGSLETVDQLLRWNGRTWRAASPPAARAADRLR